MIRRDFLKGALLSTGIIGGTSLGIKALNGDFDSLKDPLDLPKTLSVDPDNLQVILLGTGCPLPSLQRAKPAQAVLVGGKIFVVDCGAEVVNRLLQAGLAAPLIDNIFITHHHTDHNSGFVDLLVSGAAGGSMSGRNKPMNVYGPPNTRTIIGKLEEHLEWDTYLRNQQARTHPDATRINYHQTDEGLIYDQDGIKVTQFKVDHGIVKPAVGYRFDYKGKRIVISGDTLPCENLVQHAQNADILVHEAYSGRWLDKAVEMFPERAETAEGIKKYHTSVLDAAEVAKKARVKQLVLTHLIPAPAPVWYFEKHWAKGVSDIYSGKVAMGRDLMTFM